MINKEVPQNHIETAFCRYIGNVPFSASGRFVDLWPPFQRIV
jgi:hypothetical protein